MDAPRRFAVAVSILLAMDCSIFATPISDKIRVPDAPLIPNGIFKITDFGAVGDGKKMNTGAFRKAFDACDHAGGGTVVVPPGKFLTGPFHLVNHSALLVQEGAVVQAPEKFSQLGFPDPLPKTQPELNALKKKTTPFITAHDVDDVAILGRGTIDGGGAIWWKNSDHTMRGSNAPYLYRPNLIVFNHCNRVHIEGVTLQNSPQFHFVPQYCEEVLVEKVTIDSPPDSPNTDGIDPANSRNVLIRGCTIDTGDDDVALKAGGNAPCENITVTDCTIRHGHGISIGSETNSGVNNLLVQNCTFENTGTALRIKSSRTRGGKIQNVLYRNITMKAVDAAISISFYYDDRDAMKHPEFKPVTNKTPALQRVHFTDITCEDAARAGEICGLPESGLQDVELKNVHITAHEGLMLQDISGINLQNVSVVTSGSPHKRLLKLESPPTNN